MIRIRAAARTDAPAIAAVHVSAWRSAYAGILPATYLAQLSVTRQAAMYERTIARGAVVRVACNERSSARPRVVGFATAAMRGHALGDGEIETLYVLDDWREQGIGRRLLASAARGLLDTGCRTAFCWVLRDNPSRWFYQRMGGKEAGAGAVSVGGAAIPQVAYRWTPIERLVAAAPGGAGKDAAG
jgi:GNAT superfamily N-acetyltransferase